MYYSIIDLHSKGLSSIALFIETITIIKIGLLSIFAYKF